MSSRKAVALFDGQNLFHCAKREFQARYPNYDPVKLAHLAARRLGAEVAEIRFYSGVPPREYDEYYNEFWQRKLNHMQENGVVTETRALVYHRRGKNVVIPHEKGIDVRMSLDMVRIARQGNVGQIILFSCDQDFTEAVAEARETAFDLGRNLQITSFFPDAHGRRHGVRNTDWQPISKDDYELCLDQEDFRPYELSKDYKLAHGQPLQDKVEQHEKQTEAYKDCLQTPRMRAGV